MVARKKSNPRRLLFLDNQGKVQGRLPVGKGHEALGLVAFLAAGASAVALRARAAVLAETPPVSGCSAVLAAVLRAAAFLATGVSVAGAAI